MLVKNLSQFHKEVCLRENYVCRVCKKDFNHDMYFDLGTGVNQYVCAHHYPHTQKTRPDLILETDNGVCICLECHTKAHKGLVTIPELEIKEKEVETLTPPIIPSYDHILPNGQQIRLKSREKLCICGYIAIDLLGICLKCDRAKSKSFLKKEKVTK